MAKKSEKRVFLSSPTMHGEEMEFIKQAFCGNWVAPLGPNVDAFEKELAAYTKAPFCAALSAGTAALHLAVKLAGVKRGDVVICSDMTFAASVNPVSYEGGEQVFVDSEQESWNISPRLLKKALDKYPNAKAVIAVNLYGVPANLKEIADICSSRGVTLIEDAAESLSACFMGKQTGTFGDYGIFSFNGNKIITTSGGGMLATKDEHSANKARFWATQARDKALHYQHSEIGYNYRMSNITAGIGRGQLLHLDEHKAAKTRIYNAYKRGLNGLPLSMNPFLPQSEPNFWLSCIMLDKDVKTNPTEIIKKLDEYNFESRPIWKPMHMQPVFANKDFIFEDEPYDEQVFSRGICLPSDIKMTEEQQNTVIELIRDMLS